MTRPSLLVFTDLDGPLLDHDTYEFGPALVALEALRARRIPLVLVTSKTRAEVMALRERLGHTESFIVENGGASYVPVGTFGDTSADLPLPSPDGLHELWLGLPYVTIRETLELLRKRDGYPFVGFGDVSSRLSGSDPAGGLSPPFIPSWNRIVSAMPRVLEDLMEAVEADNA